MKVLLTGASGFIGSHLLTVLSTAGHQLICPVRDPLRVQRKLQAKDNVTFVQLDFTKPPTKADWKPLLQNVDVAINTVGILRQQGKQSFQVLHTTAPISLFEACAEQQVAFVVQISALGADDQARSQYHLSKKLADDYLRGLPVSAAIVQPSLVYDANGTSAMLFNRLATLPVLPLPDGGVQQVQPVHIADVVEGIVSLINARQTGVNTIQFVGPEPLSLRAYIAQLRALLGFKRQAIVISISKRLVGFFAKYAGRLPGSLLDSETFAMLQRGNTGDSGALAQLLRRSPRSVGNFLASNEIDVVRTAALLSALLPCLRWSIALVWIWTGIVSLGLYPVQESYALLARVGVSGVLASILLYGAALLDLAFGVLTLLLRGPLRSALWAGQFLLIAGYTLLITLKLPEFWLHPYGPLSKNLPMLAAIALLWALEDKRSER